MKHAKSLCSCSCLMILLPCLTATMSLQRLCYWVSASKFADQMMFNCNVNPKHCPSFSNPSIILSEAQHVDCTLWKSGCVASIFIVAGCQALKANLVGLSNSPE